MIKHSIVLVPFPFDDLPYSKIRPALCLTSSIGNYEHIIIAFISSKTADKSEESDIFIRKGSNNWEGTGLTVDSVIRLHKIVTIPKYLIKRKLGEINPSLQKIVVNKMRILFGID